MVWLLGLNSGEIVFLRIDGRVGVWQKMSDGTDGRPTPGLKPGDTRTREMWHSLFRERLHDDVSIETPEVPDAAARVLTPLEKPNQSATKAFAAQGEFPFILWDFAYRPALKVPLGDAVTRFLDRRRHSH